MLTALAINSIHWTGWRTISKNVFDESSVSCVACFMQSWTPLKRFPRSRRSCFGSCNVLEMVMAYSRTAVFVCNASCLDQISPGSDLPTPSSPAQAVATATAGRTHRHRALPCEIPSPPASTGHAIMSPSSPSVQLTLRGTIPRHVLQGSASSLAAKQTDPSRHPKSISARARRSKDMSDIDAALMRRAETLLFGGSTIAGFSNSG